MTETTMHVDGLNCSGCVGTLTKKLMLVPHVTDARVDLVPGGTSSVHVTSDIDIASSDLEGAVVAAGKRIALAVPA